MIGRSNKDYVILACHSNVQVTRDRDPIFLVSCGRGQAGRGLYFFGRTLNFRKLSLI